MNRFIEFKQLRYFSTLAHELHFGRAATILAVTQPALSHNIARLEEQLGFALFRRTTRSVQLTEAGAEFRETVRRVRDELDRGIERGRELARGSAGTLSVGYVAVAMANVLPPLVRAFCSRHPKVELRLHEWSTQPQLEALREGRLDVALVTAPAGDTTFESREIQRDSLLLAVPASLGVSARGRTSLSVVRDEPFILFPREQAPALHDQIVHLCRSNGFEPRIGQEAPSWHLVTSLVGGGLGVSIVPASVRRYRIPQVRFVALRDTPTTSIFLCVRAGVRKPVTEHLMAVARALWPRALST